MSWLGTQIRTQHDDRDVVVGIGPLDIIHDQRLTFTEARLALDAGLTERFSLSAVVPVRIVAASIRYLDQAGGELQLMTENIHHRNETLVGIADPMVLGAATFALGSWRLTARAGVTVPLGRTEEDPFASGAIGLSHQHIQFGTGTVNPVVAAEASRPVGGWRAGIYALTQQVVYDNAKGYRAGDRYAGGASLSRAFGTRWRARGGVDVQAESAERWRTSMTTDEGNRGRLDVILGAGATWQLNDQVGIELALKVPVVTHAVGGQVDMPAILEVGATWAFGGRATPPVTAHVHAEGDGHDHGDDHAHGDEHGDEHGDAHGDEHGDAHAHDDEPPADPVATGQGEPPVTTPAPPVTTPAPPVTTPAPPVTTPAPVRPVRRGPDVRDLGKGGANVDLVAVRGKLTVFDFWATWCKPCKELEAELLRLARAHPDVVAIRRIDIVDWDSPATARYLVPKGYGLPHLRIADPSGRFVLVESSKTGALQALIDKVRALVAAEVARRARVTR